MKAICTESKTWSLTFTRDSGTGVFVPGGSNRLRAVPFCNGSVPQETGLCCGAVFVRRGLDPKVPVPGSGFFVKDFGRNDPARAVVLRGRTQLTLAGQIAYVPRTLAGQIMCGLVIRDRVRLQISVTSKSVLRCLRKFEGRCLRSG